MANDYDTDGFDTVTLRVDPSTLTAAPEGPAAFHYMDAVTFVVSGLRVADPSQLAFTVVTASRAVLVSRVAGTTWAAVPGASSKVYAKYSFDTAAAQTLSASLAPGKSAPVRMYLRDPSGRTLLDCAAEFLPLPYPVDGGSGPEPASALVLKSALAAAANAALAMPSFNAAQAEARFNTLLAKLLEASV